MCQLVRGVAYEILELYRFLVTELVFLDDYLLNYMSLICHRDKIYFVWTILSQTPQRTPQVTSDAGRISARIF